MAKRKILYGYIIRNGELVIEPKEKTVVKRIFSSYIEGLSYQGIADMLNGDKIAYSSESREWNKHKVKRLLENPRYMGEDEYPAIIDVKIFAAVQRLIQSKTINCIFKEKPNSNCAKPEMALAIYTPAPEVVKIDNAINRALENAELPEVIINLILQGITARYNCCN